jgi:hypothetical protein
MEDGVKIVSIQETGLLISASISNLHLKEWRRRFGHIILAYDDELLTANFWDRKVRVTIAINTLTIQIWTYGRFKRQLVLNLNWAIESPSSVKVSINSVAVADEMTALDAQGQRLPCSGVQRQKATMFRINVTSGLYILTPKLWPTNLGFAQLLLQTV